MSRFAVVYEDPDYEEWVENAEAEMAEAEWNDMNIKLNKDSDAFSPFNTDN
jgi:hypothetical protein